MSDDAPEGEVYSLAVDLPPGSVAQFGVLVVSYFDEEGQTYWVAGHKGDASRTSRVGLLEMAKLTLAFEQ